MEPTLSQLDQKLDQVLALVDGLASSAKQGFEDVDERFNKLSTEMNSQFGEVTERLDRIENVKVGNLENRVEKLEDFRQVVKTNLKLKES